MAARIGDLAPPAGGADEQQVGDVGAGDEQHEADGADQHQQRRARRCVTSASRSGCDLEDGLLAERGRELLRVIGRRELQPRVGLLERDARRQAAGGLEVVPLILRVRVELERQPDLGVGPNSWKSTLGSEDADDRCTGCR